MNAERLLAQYERIADAPDAIARLRRFILDLAVRGKLVPQDASDEPASELLKRIAKEKARLVKTGELRKPRDLDSGDDVVEPYSIPSTWRWVRLDGVGAIVGGGTPSASDADNFAEPGEGVPWLTPADLGGYSELYISRGSRDLSETGARTSSATLMPEGTVLFTSRAPIGYVAIAANPISTNQGFKSIVPYVADCSRFIATAMKAFAPAIDAKAPGTTFKEVSGKIVAAVPFPLPPLAEQHRIVAKVDTLMALCDRLAAARAGREAVRDRLAAASLARLNAPDPETFEADARFALDALPALTTRPDQIKALRQTILNLAVRGKLVPQDANDEPASELLNRIAKERADLIKRREIRREDASDPMQPAEMPFDLPASWVWSRIGDAVLFTQYGTSQKSNPSDKGIPVLTMGNIQDGLVVWNNEKRISETSEELPALYLRKLDLLYNRTNSAELVGKTGIYLGEDGVRTFASYLIRLRPSLLSSNPQFLNMAMNTPEFRRTQIVPLIKKQTGQANVNGTALKNMLVPLPPLAEQHRIVAKVDELMGLCNRLEASLVATAATRRRLLDALLVEALAPVESTSDVNIELAAAGKISEHHDVNLTERSVYILSRAYERHRAARRDWSFGHVKAQKILHLVEAETGYDLGRVPIKDAAGPNDFRHMLDVEEWALSNKRFVFENTGGGYRFRELPRFQESLKKENHPEALMRNLIDSLIDILVPMDMREAEVFVTVYAAWNNLLLEGNTPTEEQIVKAAREDWHPNKLKIPASEFFAALKHLKLKGIVPKGIRKVLHSAHQRDLFDGERRRT